MRYEEIKNRRDKDFKRLTGVEHQTFKQIVSVLEDEMPNFGRPPKLSRADQLLMTFMIGKNIAPNFILPKPMVSAKPRMPDDPKG